MKLTIHDGRIRIDGAQGFAASLDDFDQVAPEAGVAALAAGAVTVIYEPFAPEGRPKHRRHTAEGRQMPGPVPWPEGDAILAAAAGHKAALEALWAARAAEEAARQDGGA
jgi:hypothetical protein